MALYAVVDDLRVRGERTALWCCTLAAPVTLAMISAIFPSLSFSEFVLLVVASMAYVSIARGRLLGSSIRVTDRQLPEVARLTARLAGKLGIETPHVFVRDDPFVPIVAVGIGPPYALVLSSQYYEHLRPGELAFLIARELGHIAAGHTRITSLLSATGRENAVVALTFGPWLRRTEYTADRIGTLCCEDFDDVVGAVSISTFHAIGRRIDMAALAEQRKELAAEPTLRMGEWLASAPFATNRLDALRVFSASPLARTACERLASGEARAANVRAIAPSTTVTRRDCAPLARRLAAFAIDLSVILAILGTPFGNSATHSAAAISLKDIPAIARPIVAHLPVFAMSAGIVFTLVAFFAYSAILVGLGGQTFGMMIMELRIVTTHYARPTLAQSLWRYVAALLSSISFVALAGLFLRVHPHDFASATRIVGGRKRGESR